jgi:hypothetical protein
LKLDFRIRQAADLKSLQDLSESGGGKRMARIAGFCAFSDYVHMIYLLGHGD